MIYELIELFRWTYDEELNFSLDSYSHQKGVFEVTTACKIPSATDGVLISTMICTGALPLDCDPYAQGLAYSVATGNKFGTIFLHMDEATAQGHIAYAFFWSTLGAIFTLLGLIILLYSEIKAVTVVSTLFTYLKLLTLPKHAIAGYCSSGADIEPCISAQFRERDERERLVAVNILVRNAGKYAELEAADDDKLARRPYLTMVGFIDLFIGIFCAWLPLCGVIGIIFPGAHRTHLIETCCTDMQRSSRTL